MTGILQNYLIGGHIMAGSDTEKILTGQLKHRELPLLNAFY
tara:strand:+ start:3123 stop:3245 length:123 start_codon:yes stop_codon:yes gene_type:complete